jgi:diadenosine tetraphosphate (Ap4A) HIT family hydrolase/glutathione S-transferase
MHLFLFLILLLPCWLWTSYTTALSLSSSSSLQMSSSSTSISSSSKHVLYDVPVSNNGARCRIILYKKNIPESEVAIVSPMDLGGLKSEAYLKINPLGKMPALVICHDSTEASSSGGLQYIAESDTIARYLMSTYANIGPSFQPDNAKSNLIARLHDMYLSTIQGCMYKATGPFGIYGTRQDALSEYSKQLQVMEDLIIDDDNSGSIYLCGADVSLADATLFPSCVFAMHMLPKFGINPPLPPKMTKWFNTVKDQDLVFGRVFVEISTALAKWDENNRWQGILGAGWRDGAEPPTLFDRIIRGEIPASIVKNDDKVMAFKDINPAAPAHVLVIPKHRNGLTRLTKATSGEHTEILGQLLVTAAEIARNKELGFGDGGARIVINDGPDGGQEVMHLHVHVLGGRSMTWPPG